MILLPFHEDYRHLREEELLRAERGNRQEREIHELRRAPATSPAAPAGRYTGPERRLVPCPDMKEAMTP